MEENTIADSISVGVPRNADKALMAIRESNGLAINVTDEEILAAQKLLGRTCGVFGEPAGVTGTAAVKKACELGLIEKGATVVSVVTGNGLKDVANAIKSAGEPINTNTDLNTPLIIMDGFEISLTRMMDLNDDEVESITLLKDGSATAIYGSRGANGVIVIKRKAPKAGKLKLTYTGNLNIEAPDLSDYHLLNAA